MEVGRSEIQDLRREVTKLSNAVSSLETKMEHAKELIQGLVTKAEFRPVQMISYGLAAGAMGAVLTSLIQMVVGR